MRWKTTGKATRVEDYCIGQMLMLFTLLITQQGQSLSLSLFDVKVENMSAIENRNWQPWRLIA